MPCPLHQILTAGLAIAVPWEGDAVLTRGSLVRTTGTCAAGVGVEVVAVNPWYAAGKTTPAVGAIGCLDPEHLAPAGDRFVAYGPGGGAIVGPPEDCADAVGLRPITREQEAAIVAVQAVHAELYGPIGLDRVPFTDWGFVGLPFVRELSADERAATWAHERLVSDTQREKATFALGPDEGRVYQHFLGADPRWTDTWATPDTVVRLLRLAHGWAAQCATLAEGTPETCTLQVGDLAWFNATRPDPLGHTDHHRGNCVDLRLFRSDGSRYEAWWNRPDDREGIEGAYSRPLTQAFLAWALEHEQIETLYFNDPHVIEALPAVTPQRGHDDHVHLCFAPEGAR